MAAPRFGCGAPEPMAAQTAQCAHRTRWTLGILPRVMRAWCVGWMDETEGAERYRRAVIRPYIFAGRTIFLLKSGSFSRCFPLSNVAYLCGAPVKSETGRSRRFFFSLQWFDSFFFLLFSLPFFLLFHAFSIKELNYSVLWFNKYISFPSVYLVCVCLLCSQVWSERAESIILLRAIGQVFHSEIVCPKDVPNFHL